MQEIELKFQIPPRGRDALASTVDEDGAVRAVRLQARYFDTAARDLAGAAFALRLRAPDRTLTVDEVAAAREAALAEATARTGAVLRA